VYLVPWEKWFRNFQKMPKVNTQNSPNLVTLAPFVRSFVKSASIACSSIEFALRRIWIKISSGFQGCQMAYFQTKNPYLGKFWWVLQWKKLVNFRAMWSVLRPLGIFCGHSVYFTVIMKVYFSRFGMLYPEKSGNPDYLGNFLSRFFGDLRQLLLQLGGGQLVILLALRGLKIKGKIFFCLPSLFWDRCYDFLKGFSPKKYRQF
jgi:hypothetical protein